MSVKFKTVTNQFPEMEATLKDLNGKKVNVGVLGGGENAWLAGIHEYGCRIKVTPKMRAWFHHQGVHLKPTTTEIVIPERSFLRGGFDEHHEKVIKMSEPYYKLFLDGKITAERYCRAVGILLSSKIKAYATNLDSPPNADLTKEWKGSSNPLVDTGDMIGSITYEVE